MIHKKTLEYIVLKGVVFYRDLGISVICSTNKVVMISNILESFISQDYIRKELLIIINYDSVIILYILLIMFIFTINVKKHIYNINRYVF